MLPGSIGLFTVDGYTLGYIRLADRSFDGLQTIKYDFRLLFVCSIIGLSTAIGRLPNSDQDAYSS